MIKLGVHNSTNGGILNVIDECKYLKTNTTQFFIHSPRTWFLKDIKEYEINKFVSEIKSMNISPVVIHSSYLINPLSENEETKEKSLRLLSCELELSVRIRADYYVLHIRCNKNKTIDENIEESLTFFKKLKYTGKTKILIENSSSGFTSKISTVVLFYKRLKKTGLFGGICLDTAHLFEAGYNIKEKNGIERLKDEVEDINLIKLIHLNDSKTDLNSNVDRHQHIGKGKIGNDGFKNFFLFKAFQNIPLILETPKKNLKDDLNNLMVVMKILGI